MRLGRLEIIPIFVRPIHLNALEDTLPEEAVAASIQSLLAYVGDLENGLGQTVGLICKSFRCHRSREKTDWVLQAKIQTEQLSTYCRPQLLSRLVSSIGALLASVGRYEEALESCQKAIALNPKSVKALVNQGAALLNLERYEEALSNCQKAIALNPKSFEAWYNQGNALDDLERYDSD